MKIWQEMLGNQILVSSVAGWVVAQLLKTIIDCSLNHGFSAERLVGSGGMPSSHSSTVCALVVSSGICCGVSSSEFAVSFVLAAVVMYDAIGVRQETGKGIRRTYTVASTCRSCFGDYNCCAGRYGILDLKIQ